MFRRDLSYEELEKVIKLCQFNPNWSKIERETGIPRRAAKRAYEDWDRNRKEMELREIRRDVIAEEFRKHLDNLLRLAELIAGNLPVPKSPNEDRDADTVLLDVLRHRDIYKQLESDNIRLSNEEAQIIKRRIIRQNQMLYNSLQVHTSKEEHWKMLENWKSEWNDCVQHLAGLQKEATEVFDKYLKQERDDVREKIKGGSGNQDAEKSIQEGALWCAWWLNMGNAPKDNITFTTEKSRKGHKVVSPGSPPITYNDPTVASQAVRLGNNIITKLKTDDFGEEAWKEVVDGISRIEHIKRELEEMLDPLLLRPMILRSRCELCPV